MNMFERAARMKLRFNSSKGPLSTEMLFDLPLTSSRQSSLDNLARDTHQRIQSAQQGSFVEEVSEDTSTDQLRLDILKAVIASKLSARKAAETRAANDDKRRKLIEALAAKEGEELQSKSADELRAELAAIGS